MSGDRSTLADRLEITDVLNRYATALDTRDWALLASCFTDEAALDYDTSGVFRLADFVANCATGLAPMKATQHVVTNHVIGVDGDRAQSTSYVVAQHVRSDDALFTLGGTYHDVLARTPDGWRIADRRFVTSWTSGRLRA